MVFASNLQEHSQRLTSLLLRARAKGLVSNPSKCAIGQSEVQFFGNIYSKDGVKPDPVKVQAIAQLKAPSTTKELQSLLGMVTYISPFIPHLSEHTTHLRKLLQKDVDFQWQPEHEEAFMTLKRLICEAGSLPYFDPSK